MKTSRLLTLSDKTTAHDRVSGEEKMGSIERRKFSKAATVGGVALSIGAPRVCSPRTDCVRKERLTSWTGDVYADIETEMLPWLKSVKVSVKWSGRKGLVE